MHKTLANNFKSISDTEFLEMWLKHCPILCNLFAPRNKLLSFTTLLDMVF